MNIEVGNKTQLAEFVNAYLECALWLATDENDESIDGLYTIDDFSESAIKEANEECSDFIETNLDTLNHIRDTYTIDHAGYDFYLTRNGHGAGFWDRGLGDDGDTLTTMAEPYGSNYVFVGDDNKLEIE